MTKLDQFRLSIDIAGISDERNRKVISLIIDLGQSLESYSIDKPKDDKPKGNPKPENEKPIHPSEFETEIQWDTLEPDKTEMVRSLLDYVKGLHHSVYPK